jgi:hypothetical protein
MEVRHVIVVTDSCYAGKLARDRTSHFSKELPFSKRKLLSIHGPNKNLH